MSNDNNTKIKSVIKGFSGRDNVIAFPLVYAKICGDLNTAIILNQIIYWSDRTKRKDGYFYKSYKDWEKETTLSKYQVRRAVEKLKKLGLVNTKLLKANNAPTLHYICNIDELTNLIIEELDNEETGKSRNSTMDSEETELSKVKELNYGKSRNSTMDSEETELSSIQRLQTEITTEITTETTTECKEEEDPCNKIINCWNALPEPISKLITLNKGTQRYNHTKARIAEYGLDLVLGAIETIDESSFLKGVNDRGWIVSYDWFIKPNNFIKVAEGNYKDNTRPPKEQGGMNYDEIDSII